MERARRVRRRALRGVFVFVLGLAAASAARAATDGALKTWQLAGGTLESDSDDSPRSVGSLQKPFVAEAWARSHPGATPPRLRCDESSHCWRPGGHGRLGLTRALAASCNTYFRELAAETPQAILESTLRAEGFDVPLPLQPEAAIGLPSPQGVATIRPSALLAAYVRLTRTPWPSGEAVRQAVLEGLRDSSREGTAAGIGHRGLWAKTGTVAAVDGAPLATSGWALAVDDSGWSILGLLPRGTGHEAARALAEPLARWRPWSLPARDPGEVRVALFEALAPRAIVARNLGDAPTAGSRGYVGPGASLALRPGDRLEAGRWELTIPARGLLRRIQGAVECSTARDGALRLTADLTRREYVAGVLLAELPVGDAERRRELGAAVLRFLAGGPRHGAVDVCDTTHCAWFVGRGPRVRWATGGRVALLAEPAPPAAQPEAFDDGTWADILSRAAQPGPMQWTAHCGGQPLSARFVWGHGEGRAAACPRHRGGHDAPWRRRWSARDVARAFGAAVPSLAVTEVDGVWTLRAGPRHYRYDEAHRLLSSVLGWDALPSPASQIRAVAGGFEAQGVGSGHRVGLCLAD